MPEGNPEAPDEGLPDELGDDESDEEDCAPADVLRMRSESL